MRLALSLIGSRYNTHTTAERAGRCYMQDFARKFYLSKIWRDTREYIYKRDMGLCVRCGKPGEIVHHKIRVSEMTINDPSVLLSFDNLELLCRQCHEAEHYDERLRRGKGDHDAKRFFVDENGKIHAIIPPISEKWE